MVDYEYMAEVEYRFLESRVRGQRRCQGSADAACPCSRRV